MIKVSILEKQGSTGAKVLDALRQRGHSDKDIDNMTTSKAFDEYVAWHLGDPAWGLEFRQVIKALSNGEVRAHTITELLGDPLRGPMKL